MIPAIPSTIISAAMATRAKGKTSHWATNVVLTDITWSGEWMLNTATCRVAASDSDRSDNADLEVRLLENT